jgi:hypothetical protein
MNIKVMQYYIHRYLHSPSAPKSIVRMHKSYYHSITAPYCFVAHYDHPLVHLLWRFVPIYLPAIAFRLHFLTYLLLVSVVSVEETLALSGYTVIPGIMLGGIQRRQGQHSQFRGRGNYAPWGLMDWIHGTNIGSDVVDDLKDEAGKHKVVERSNRVLRSARESGQAGLNAWGSGRKLARRA